MKEQELIIFKNKDNGVTYYQHRCEVCPPINLDDSEFTKKMNIVRAVFNCNTMENKCRSISQHYCNGCKQVVCYFHHTFIYSDMYCKKCVNSMVAYIRKENEENE